MIYISIVLLQVIFLCMMYYCLTGEKEQKQEQQKDISGQKKIKKK